MSEGRIFADDWRDCLREQYKYVIRQQDHRTEATLTDVLHQVGFTDDELAALRLDATMRADDMPDDYVPEEVQAAYAGVDVPEASQMVADEPADAVVEADEDAIEDETPATYDELLEQAEETLAEEEVPGEPDEPDDAPEQLSLF